MVTDNSAIKLLDFGLSKKASNARSATGTPFYMAPEIVKGNSYDWHCDIWSLGVLLYILLSGYMPFPAKSRAELFDKITDGTYNFNHKEFYKVSPEAKDLITQMLKLSPSKRPSAAKILEHPWFKKFNSKEQSSDEGLDIDVLMRLKSYKGENFFKRAAMNILVKMSSEDQLKNLSTKFKEMDLDGTGMISMSEIKQFI